MLRASLLEVNTVSVSLSSRGAVRAVSREC
jgi:hypothetical protein